MPVFQDNAGRDWLIQLDGLTLKDLRDTHKIDLADVGGADWVKIETDPATLTVAVCFLCGEQAKSKALTAKQLAQSLDGAALESALSALWESAKLFFPPKLLSALLQHCSQRRQAAEQWASLEPVMALLNRPEMPAAMRDAVMAAIGEMIQTMKTTASPPSAESPSVTGLADTQSPPATSLPDSAVSTLAG